MPTCCDTFILRPGALDPFSCQPAAQARCALSTGRVVLEVDGIAFGKLEIGGAMTLAGMLQVLSMGAGILPHNFYAILDAVGTRTGTFYQLETTGIAVAYDGTRVVLCNPPPRRRSHPCHHPSAHPQCRPKSHYHRRRLAHLRRPKFLCHHHRCRRSFHRPRQSCHRHH